jgi:hypothetical protein
MPERRIGLPAAVDDGEVLQAAKVAGVADDREYRTPEVLNQSSFL